ncbi:oligosaccharide flippase family protein [Acinetobacter sp. ANC 5383]
MSNNTKILRNILYLIFRTLLSSLISLFTVREVLKILGVQEYGLFNLVFGVATLFSFINGAMISSTQRYLSYYIGKKDNDLLNEIWRSSLLLHTLIGIVVVCLLFCFKTFILNELLSIDLIYVKSASFIFNLAAISIFISIFQAPFNALILAKEEMRFYAALSLYDAISKIIIVYCLYFFSQPLLEKYTVLYVGSSLMVLIFYIIYCNKKYNKKINLQVSNIPILKDIFFYSLWNIFGNFAATIKMQGLNILLNIFFGIIVNSAYAITNIVVGVISGLISSITTAINSQIYKSYAEEDVNRNTFLIIAGSKFSFFLCLIIVLPILLNTHYILELWLHEVPKYLVEFVQLALIVLLIDCLSSALMTGIQATGKIKIYQVFVSILVFLNLPISYIVLLFIHKPLVIYLVAIFMSLISFGLRLYFLNRLSGFSILAYVRCVIIKIVTVFIISLALTWYLKNMLEASYSLLILFISLIFTILIVLVNIYIFGLSLFEKKFLQEQIRGYMK